MINFKGYSDFIFGKSFFSSDLLKIQINCLFYFEIFNQLKNIKN